MAFCSSPHIERMRLSTSSPLLLVGAGGHAKVVIELFRAVADHEIVGLIDLNLNLKGASVLGVPILGTDVDLPRLRREGIKHAFVGIGSNQRRLQMGRHLTQLGFEIVNAISPAAIISVSARLGRGIAVMAGVVINADVRIDDFAVINTRASVDHDCWIGEGAHVAPGSTIAGNVKIGRLAFVGAGATAIPGTNIGENAVVGAGACVIRDVPTAARVWGVPAKIMRIGNTVPAESRDLSTEPPTETD
jgi:UDP-perosamine 4-acetyltransferase